MIRTAIVAAGLSTLLLAQGAYGQGTSGARRPAPQPQRGQGQRVQAPPQRYQPSRPTISPYLNLLRQNESPVPNYYSFVRPQLQTQERYQQQQAINFQQQTAIGTLDEQVLQMTQPAAATGGGGNFRQYSHFYPGLGVSP